MSEETKAVAPETQQTETPKEEVKVEETKQNTFCLLYTSPSPRDGLLSRMPSSA